MNEIAVGTVLGNYSLDAAIGRGGFGYVFRASRRDRTTDEQLPEEFALKAASPRIDSRGFPGAPGGPNTRCIFDADGLFFNTGSYCCGPVGWEAVPHVLREEFDLLQRLDGGTFPVVFDFVDKLDVCYYVMEYVSSWDLRAILARERPEDRRRWIPRLREVLVSLSEVRSCHPDFYHGDLKPENILIDTDGRIRLIDPALRNQDGVLRRTLTIPYNPLGLAGPEADTFAVAAIVAELLLGLPAFTHVGDPLVEYCCSGLRGRMAPKKKRLAIESHLRLHELQRALPRSLREPIIDWMLDPGDYDGMLKHWHLIDDGLSDAKA